ncbi:MAG: hypothetical protein JWO56_3648, partial [Acidobacteria bacterium]|nr:hypothetical protein [Acidobacteriota bacterium]
AELIRGAQAQALPLLEVYDLAVHAQVLEEFMAGPDYLNLSPEVQAQMDARRLMLQDAEMAKQVKDLETQGDMATVQHIVAAKVAAHAPPPPPGAAPAGGPPPASPTGAPPGDSAGQAA